MLRKPCAVIWSLEYPSLRSAPLSVVSLSGRPPPRIAGNTQRPAARDGPQLAYLPDFMNFAGAGWKPMEGMVVERKGIEPSTFALRMY